MQLYKSLPLQICLLFSLIIIEDSLCSALSTFPIRSDYYFHDVYKFNFASSLVSMSSQWRLNGVVDNASKETLCPTRIFGGVGSFKGGDSIERTYDSLPPHVIVFYKFELILIDDWRMGDTMELRIDDKISFSFEPHELLKEQSILINQCGDSNLKDLIVTLVGAAFHTARSLTFSINSSPQNSQAFFGFADVRISLKTFTQITTEFSYLKTQISQFLTLPKVSPCRSGYYFQANESPNCQVCHSSCLECIGPSSSDCIGCANYYSYDVETDACVGCTTGCIKCGKSQINECYLCRSPQILFWNHTCQTSCDPPYIHDSVNSSCMTPCQAHNSYMLIDNTCLDSCLPPLVPRIEIDAKFCDSPCNQPSSEYLYWNGSCASICPFYSRTVKTLLFCDACSPNNKFMYPNNTCLPACPPPYKQRFEGGSSFCDYPCQGEKIYYFEKNAECRAVCNYPYQVYENLFCGLRLSSEQVAGINASKAALSVAQTSINSAGVTFFFFQASNPTAIVLQSFINMLGYMKYLKVDFPPKLQYTFNLKVENPFQNILEPPEKLIMMSSKSPLPERFEEDGLHSRFLVNFWPSLLFLTVLVSLICIFTLLECFLEKFRYTKFVSHFMKNALKWNFSLGFFTSYFEDIILFISLELKTMNPTRLFDVISYLICFCINLIGLVVFGKIIIIIHYYWKFVVKTSRRKDSKLLNPIRANLNSNKIIFSEYHDKSIFQVSFLLIFITRRCAYAGLISYFIHYQLFQTVSIVVINISMILYLGINRPLKSTIDLAQYLLQEIALLIANVCVLVLAVFDTQNDGENTNTRDLLGEIILGCNFALSGISLLYLTLQALLLLIKLYKAIIRSYNKGELNTKLGEKNSSNPIKNDYDREMPTNSGPMQKPALDQTPNISDDNHLTIRFKRTGSPSRFIGNSPVRQVKNPKPNVEEAILAKNSTSVIKKRNRLARKSKNWLEVQHNENQTAKKNKIILICNN